MNSFHTTTARAQDIRLAHAIHQQVVPTSWRLDTFTDSTTSPYCLRTLWQNQRLIGYAIILMVVDEATVIDIGVHQDARGQGAGRYLLNDVITCCQQRQMASLWLEVRASNQIARGLYETSGFVTQEVRKAYYPAADANAQAEDAIIMSYTLFR
ncbi:ribosomal protein S18-alanine N-acetyltransferase [Salinimonas marina]|uniref:[Ribosomal protein bS18]-alanine N-acetyltransferase n=1 Tax=Salinimonas marina TaxID=2785918 RepID=A0A7S9DVT4_9ALTE|nr:ribosomal protein S18-alanine N-acetyltransferase [Salinimonas marina]QPG04871.1 ribosomal protein S18-alanine N-acetyltransferase [Salinimonas marina]